MHLSAVWMLILNSFDVRVRVRCSPWYRLVPLERSDIEDKQEKWVSGVTSRIHRGSEVILLLNIRLMLREPAVWRCR
jgi:hypothetical protein